MEGQAAKRRRVYSPEPNKVAQSLFTRNYVNYLVPALKKIKEKNSSNEEEGDCSARGSYLARSGEGRCTQPYSRSSHVSDNNLKNVVKYEVDMAMVLSSQGFAWSNGLKAKLQRDNATTTTILNPNSKSKDMEGITEKDFARNGDDDDGEDMMTEKQMRILRGLMPGGEEMKCDDEQMVTELESYISCLQMQVKVLQCLASSRSR